MLRDKFAMAAMQGILTSGESWNHGTIGRDAYDIAAAMMREREKQDFSGDPEAVTVAYNANHIHHGVDAHGKTKSVPGEWQPDWSQAPEWATIFQTWGDGTATWYDKIGHTKSTEAPLFGFPPLMTTVKKRPTKKPVPPEVDRPPLKTGY